MERRECEGGGSDECLRTICRIELYITHTHDDFASI